MAARSTQNARAKRLYTLKQPQLKKKNKKERRTVPFCFMVEDKMKKMKNCYLHY